VKKNKSNDELFKNTGVSSASKHEVASDITNPKKLFDTWLTAPVHKFRPRTKVVYRAILGRFATYADTMGIALNQITDSHIRNYLNSLKTLKRNQRERHQNLLERVFREVFTQVGQDNPAAIVNVFVPKGSHWRAAPENNPKQFLSRKQRALVKDKVIKIASEFTIDGGSKQWTLTRDTAMVALFFGAGLRVAELVFLARSGISVDEGKICIDLSEYHGYTRTKANANYDPHRGAVHAYKGEDSGPNRVVTLTPWANNAITNWLTLLPKDSRHLFVGRGDDSAEPLNPSTVARRVAAWGAKQLNMAITAQLLRNSFGSILIDEGMNFYQIEPVMGYSPNAASGFRFEQAWIEWQAANGESPL